MPPGCGRGGPGRGARAGLPVLRREAGLGAGAVVGEGQDALCALLGDHARDALGAPCELGVGRRHHAKHLGHLHARPGVRSGMAPPSPYTQAGRATAACRGPDAHGCASAVQPRAQVQCGGALQRCGQRARCGAAQVDAPQPWSGPHPPKLAGALLRAEGQMRVGTPHWCCQGARLGARVHCTPALRRPDPGAGRASALVRATSQKASWLSWPVK